MIYKSLKISICIPQFNRIQFLEKNLKIISQQTYPDIEVVVSDDCSTDNTEQVVEDLKQNYKYPLIYQRNKNNLGYDRNFRQSIELAQGDYCFLLGNDDSLNGENSIELLVHFLEKSNYPDLGFCNYAEEHNKMVIYERAAITGVLGTGYELALKQCTNFSFVAGLIYKRETFLKYNTNRFDGSIYVQMYLSCLMIASNCSLFAISECWVIKDIQIGAVSRNSYVDKIAKNWKEMRTVDGGLPSVIHVLVSSFNDAGVLTQQLLYRIFCRIYSTTYPHWLLDYRSHGALPESIGLMQGLNPKKNKWYSNLNIFNKIRVFSLFYFSSIMGLIIPTFLFVKYKPLIYKWLRQWKKFENK